MKRYLLSICLLVGIYSFQLPSIQAAENETVSRKDIAIEFKMVSDNPASDTEKIIVKDTGKELYVQKNPVITLKDISHAEVIITEADKSMDVMLRKMGGKLAVPEGSRSYRTKYPPVQFYHFSQNAWKAGIEEHKMDGYTVRIYSFAKTIADCFKFRSKVGIDVAHKALKNAVLEKHVAPAEIMRYAKICRVHNIIQPMLEIIL